MFKSKKGFTLVELIVVIAILAILAGVAIPVYNGYIKRAQDAAVVTELDAIQTAAQAANATVGKIVKIEVNAGGTEIKVAGEGNKLASSFNEDFDLFYPDATPGDHGVFTVTSSFLQGSYAGKGATWENGKWTAGTSGTIGTQDKSDVIGGGTTSGGGSVVPDHTHSYTESVTKAATCTAAGEKTFTCTCGNSYTEAISALGHVDANGDYICDHDGCNYKKDGENWALPTA